MTSQQLFQQLFLKYGPSSCLTIKVFDYSVPTDQRISSVFVWRESEKSVQLVPGSIKRKPQKRNDKLPFGLKAVRKKRKRNTGKSLRPHAKAARAGTNSAASLADVITPGQDVDQPFILPDASDPESGVSADEHPSCDDSSASSSNSSSDSSDTEGEPLPVDPRQRMEESATREILRSHAAMTMQVSQQVSQSTGSSSFCNKTVGLCEIGVQTAAKLAKCRFCSEPIQRQSQRVGYAYSKVKFHAWLHLQCFPMYLKQQDGCKEQAKSFVKEWLDKNPSCSSQRQHELKDLVAKLDT